MAISDVRLKNNYYEVYDSSGKKISDAYYSKGELLGYSSDTMLFKKDRYFYTYDENFKIIAEKYESSIGEFKNMTGSSINFIKDRYLYCYDKYFKKISERYIG